MEMKMDYAKKALDQFIENDQENLINEFIVHSVLNGNEEFVDADSEEIKDWKAFDEYVYEHNEKAIDELEEQLKKNDVDDTKSAREYANQVLADYKYAQTGRF